MATPFERKASGNVSRSFPVDYPDRAFNRTATFFRIFTVIPIAIVLGLGNRAGAYLALMDDRYPATGDHQSVRLDYSYPDAPELNRWLPLVKWLVTIPHYIVLFFLDIGAFVAVVIAWFAILFSSAPPFSRPVDPQFAS